MLIFINRCSTLQYKNKNASILQYIQKIQYISMNKSLFHTAKKFTILTNKFYLITI